MLLSLIHIYNIEAIRTAFILDRKQRTATTEERAILQRYCGFGGLKWILNPAKELTDAVRWAKSDLELFAPTVELHRLILAVLTDKPVQLHRRGEQFEVGFRPPDGIRQFLCRVEDT